jgi:hypothetical protein
MPITPGLYRQFICPLCQSDDYRYVSFSQEGRKYVRMSWFRCAGCTVMFEDPERFTRLVRRTTVDNYIKDEPLRGEGRLMTFAQRMQQEIDDKRALEKMNGGGK